MPNRENVGTYAVGRVSRLTGLSPDVLRAWERRYGAVEPIRTPGGTRRYRPSDIDRLRLLKDAVDAGHRIGEVAGLPNEELERRLAGRGGPLPGPSLVLDDTLKALERLDAAAAEARISSQMAALGPVRFAKEFALPLLRAIGDGWASNRLCVASEHLGSSLLRSLLGSALRPMAAYRDAPIVVFGTLSGERHEMGLLVAALTALGAGASPLYLGADLPVAELVHAAAASGARAVAISCVQPPTPDDRAALAELRAGLPASVELWIGGPAAATGAVPERVVVCTSLEQLERRVELLRI